jgi:tetratricopeptide (TPR) repeat protein
MFRIILGFGLISLLIACGNDPTANDDSDTTIEEVETIASITQAIETGALHPELFYKRALLYFQNRNLEKAAVDIMAALHKDSLNVNYLHLLSDIQLNALQSRKALETLEHAVKIEPQNRMSLLKLFELQILLRQYIPAISTSQRLLVIDPQDQEAFFLRGLVFKEQHIDSLAIVNFQRAVDLDPDMTDAFILLGDLHEKKSDPLAKGYYQNAVISSPENINALFALAFYLQNHNEPNEALDLYDRMMTIDPNYSAALVNKGIILLEMDSLKMAQIAFQQAVDIDSSFSISRYYLAKCLELSGNIKAAKAQLEQVLEIDPEFEEAKQTLRRLN